MTSSGTGTKSSFETPDIPDLVDDIVEDLTKLIVSSGILKLSEIRQKLGISSEVKFSQLYLDGSFIKSKFSRNSGHPTTGRIKISNLYNKIGGI